MKRPSPALTSPQTATLSRVAGEGGRSAARVRVWGEGYAYIHEEHFA